MPTRAAPSVSAVARGHNHLPAWFMTQLQRDDGGASERRPDLAGGSGSFGVPTVRSPQGSGGDRLLPTDFEDADVPHAVTRDGLPAEGSPGGERRSTCVRSSRSPLSASRGRTGGRITPSSTSLGRHSGGDVEPGAADGAGAGPGCKQGLQVAQDRIQAQAG